MTEARSIGKKNAKTRKNGKKDKISDRTVTFLHE